MTLLSTSLNTIGLIFLAHAAYSAYEHTAFVASIHDPASLSSSPSSAPDASVPASTALPLDITLETLLSVLVLCAGVVLSSPALRPIRWRAWAGKVVREGGKGGEKAAREGVVNPYVGLEERPGFVDIRAKRKEFADWVREGGKSEGK